jgi:mitochondrial FAD-linked sulfhydryl oxidase
MEGGAVPPEREPNATPFHSLTRPHPPSLSLPLTHSIQIDVLTRVYPCGECASHFSALVRARPPRVGTGRDLRGWVCGIHNDVNAALGKPAFNCALVGARWAPLDCGGEGGEEGSGGACALGPPGRKK